MTLDWKQAYLVGIRDGVRLAQSKTMREAEDIGDEIEADTDADLRAVRAELERRGAVVEPDRDDMDEKLERRDQEWRHKFEQRENQWKQHLHELGKKMKAMIHVICQAMNLVHDADTADKMERVVKTGLERLNAIESAAATERNPEAPLN